MDQEYPFRPRGKHGFDRNDVINYITQAKLHSNEHLAHIEELEAAKTAWHSQAKTLEREKAALVSRNRELEEQLERVVVNPEKTGGEWLLHQDEFSAAELGALKTRCLELEGKINELRQENDTLMQERDALPRFAAVDTQEADSLREETAELREQVTSLEAEKAAYAEQLPALQEQLAALGEHAEKIAGLEAAKAELTTELDSAKAQLDTVLEDHLTKLAEAAEQMAALEAAKVQLTAELGAAQESAAQAIVSQDESNLELIRERNTLAQKAEALEAAELQARQRIDSLTAECDQMRRRLNEIEAEQQKAANGEDTLRSMMASSFTYANLYVENNLKTAELISEATSRNIGHVSDSAVSLLEQVEAISRSFGDTTDHIRRNLTVFQQELSGIQAGMNRRLSKDRFKVLLEENDKLRESLENELIAEMNSDEDTPAMRYEAAPNQGAPPPLPFAEDLPESYQAYMDE